MVWQILDGNRELELDECREGNIAESELQILQLAAFSPSRLRASDYPIIAKPKETATQPRALPFPALKNPVLVVVKCFPVSLLELQQVPVLPVAGKRAHGLQVPVALFSEPLIWYYYLLHSDLSVGGLRCNCESRRVY